MVLIIEIDRSIEIDPQHEPYSPREAQHTRLFTRIDDFMRREVDGSTSKKIAIWALRFFAILPYGAIALIDNALYRARIHREEKELRYLGELVHTHIRYKTPSEYNLTDRQILNHLVEKQGVNPTKHDKALSSIALEIEKDIAKLDAYLEARAQREAFRGVRSESPKEAYKKCQEALLYDPIIYENAGEHEPAQRRLAALYKDKLKSAFIAEMGEIFAQRIAEGNPPTNAELPKKRARLMKAIGQSKSLPKAAGPKPTSAAKEEALTRALNNIHETAAAALRADKGRRRALEIYNQFLPELEKERNRIDRDEKKLLSAKQSKTIFQLLITSLNATEKGDKVCQQAERLLSHHYDVLLRATQEVLHEERRAKAVVERSNALIAAARADGLPREIPDVEEIEIASVDVERYALKEMAKLHERNTPGLDYLVKKVSEEAKSAIATYLPPPILQPVSEELFEL